ncbi:Sulfite exporter TauE/SafE [Stieleria bergensis]|uniref:Probable membrane transporter protein n=1 Tax=Stieleria bergensis TaxID=2528025 RepID=A0A517SZB9_9BACT|nr:Sulfite exporter TauE/SafE [Planctomycetes bacterium SV_7m_r]
MWIVLVGATIIGLTLGLLGSGGSAITVPVLIYLIGHGGKESIAESMAIVGLISIVAAIPYGRAHQIDWRSVLYFGVPGMMGTYAGAWLGGMSSEVVQLIVFGFVLIAAAYSMLRKPRLVDEANKTETPSAPVKWIALEGTGVGVLTGFVGVGGGFLIVPALVMLGHLPMRLAIGTSLVIIAAKSAVGFAKYQSDLAAHSLSVDMRTIVLFVVIGIVGSVLGRWANQRLNQQTLKQAFGIFLIVLGGFVIFSEGAKFLS